MPISARRMQSARVSAGSSLARERARDQLEQLARVDQARAAAGMHRPRGPGELRAPGGGAGGGVGEDRHLVLGLLDREREACVEQLEQIAGRRSLGDVGAQRRQASR